MKFRPILLGSVSVAALATAAGMAQAQDALPGGYTVSVEGSAQFGTNTVAEDKLGSAGSASEIQDNFGYHGAVAVGQRVDESLDWKLALGFTEQMPSESSVVFSGGSGGYGVFTNDFDFQTADLELGFRPEVGVINLRLFGGVRAMHFNDSLDKLGYSSGGPGGSGAEFNYSNEFFGAGPRIGIEGSLPLGDSMFGISGMAAASAIYGVQRGNADYTLFSGGLVSPSFPLPPQESWGTVLNLEAALGLDVHMNDSTTVTVGLRGETVSGLSNYSGGSGGPSDSRFSYGPTVKLTSSF